jgi:hypothetical protein
MHIFRAQVVGCLQGVSKIEPAGSADAPTREEIRIWHVGEDELAKAPGKRHVLAF